MTAVPDSGYVFSYWVISGNVTPGHNYQISYNQDTNEVTGSIPANPIQGGIDSLIVAANPLNIKCGFGYTYNYIPIFALASGSQPTPSATGGTPSVSDAVAVIQPAVGGTTTPPAGTYTYANGTTFAMTATPNAGYTFSYWAITGNVTSVYGSNYALTYNQDTNQITGYIPANPLQGGADNLMVPAPTVNLQCGYGLTYYYTPVFTTISSTTSPTPVPTTSTAPTATAAPTAEVTATPAPADMTTTYVIIAVVVIIIIIIAVVVAVMMRRKK